MRSDRLTVYIVEDDERVRDSLARMLAISGYSTAPFADAESFLAAWRENWHGCVVTDLRLPGRSGLELQKELRARNSVLPVILITAHGDVPTAREALLAQAVDFLEKPFEHAQLRGAIERAFALEERRIEDAQAQSTDASRLARLTPREREVLVHAAEGLHAKQIGAALGISPRTVEVHKMRIMEKLEVKNMAELVRFAISTDVSKKP